MENVDVVIRPEDITVTAASDDTINGTVETVTFKGVHYEMIVESFGFKWIIHSTKAAEQGAYIGLSFTPDDIHIMKKSYASPSTVESRILMEAEGGGLDE